MDVRERLGRFFLLIGSGLLALYLLSDLARQPEFNYLFGGLLVFLLGLALVRRYRQPPKKPQRGTLVKKLLARSKKPKGEKGPDQEKKETPSS